MSVYVDALVVWSKRPPWNRGSCHLSADTLDELHAFALRLGLKRAWFQDHVLLPHYDLVPSKRALAVTLGAIEEGCVEGARRRRLAREAATRVAQANGQN